jgi:hypothetical protein
MPATAAAFTLWHWYRRCSVDCVQCPREDAAATLFSWPLRAAYYVALALLALSTAVLLAALIMPSFIDEERSSSPSRQTESPLTNPAWRRPGVRV